jgi:hypothetical protein
MPSTYVLPSQTVPDKWYFISKWNARYLATPKVIKGHAGGMTYSRLIPLDFIQVSICSKVIPRPINTKLHKAG